MTIQKSALILLVVTLIAGGLLLAPPIEFAEAPPVAVPDTVRTAAPAQSAEFSRYWFGGKAEISRYRLEQARYGEIHEGDAVLIFVTEDFLPELQVKADDANRQRSGAWPILKVNATRKFNTGIYPYSIMSSTFTPLDLAAHPRSLKSTTSVQEWCGHTFLQLNLRDDQYRVRGFSYFQSEGDQDQRLPGTWLEDELFTRLRLDPDSLPTGRLQVIPSGQYLRLLHAPLEALTASGRWLEEQDGVRRYQLSYNDVPRSLTIHFQAAFPHRIEGWEETVSRGARRLTTRATRTHTIQTDYWNRNSVSDLPEREKLGLK